jgi:hypothetical protein
MKGVTQVLRILAGLIVLFALVQCRRNAQERPTKGKLYEQRTAPARPDSASDLEKQVGDLIDLIRRTPLQYDDPRTTPEGLRMVFEAIPKLKDLYHRMSRDRFVAACMKHGLSRQAAEDMIKGW